MKFCPKCRSTDIELFGNEYPYGIGAPATYICKKCGFTSKVFPEVEPVQFEKLKKKMNAKLK